MDMINHVQYVFSVLKKKPDYSIDFNDSTNRAVFDFIRKHHTVIDPTLGVFELAFRSLKDNITDIEPNFALLPEPLKPYLLIRVLMTVPVLNVERLSRRISKRSRMHCLKTALQLLQVLTWVFPVIVFSGNWNYMLKAG
jgi:hypothetical protein